MLGPHRRKGFFGNGDGLAACAVGRNFPVKTFGGDPKVVAEPAKRWRQRTGGSGLVLRVCSSW